MLSRWAARRVPAIALGQDLGIDLAREHEITLPTRMRQAREQAAKLLEPKAVRYCLL